MIRKIFNWLLASLGCYVLAVILFELFSAIMFFHYSDRSMELTDEYFFNDKMDSATYYHEYALNNAKWTFWTRCASNPLTFNLYSYE